MLRKVGAIDPARYSVDSYIVSMAFGVCRYRLTVEAEGMQLSAEFEVNGEPLVGLAACSALQRSQRRRCASDLAVEDTDLCCEDLSAGVVTVMGDAMLI